MPIRIRRELSRNGRRRAAAAGLSGRWRRGDRGRRLGVAKPQGHGELRGRRAGAGGRLAAPSAVAGRSASGKEREPRVAPGAAAIPRQQRPRAAWARPGAHADVGTRRSARARWCGTAARDRTSSASARLRPDLPSRVPLRRGRRSTARAGAGASDCRTGPSQPRSRSQSCDRPTAARPGAARSRRRRRSAARCGWSARNFVGDAAGQLERHVDLSVARQRHHADRFRARGAAPAAAAAASDQAASSTSRGMRRIIPSRSTNPSARS